MTDVATIENAAMERREAMETRPQDRYAGRRKFPFCRQCGSRDGMQSVGREILEEMPRTIEGGKILATWHREPGNSEYLFHPRLSCNKDKIIPAGYIAMAANEVLDWIDRDPIAPD